VPPLSKYDGLNVYLDLSPILYRFENIGSYFLPAYFGDGQLLLEKTLTQYRNRKEIFYG